MKFIIRKAEKKDIHSLMKLYEETHGKKALTIGERNEKIFENLLEDDLQIIIVGEKNGKIAACLSVSIVRSIANGFFPLAIVEDLAVKDGDEEIVSIMLSKAQEIALKNSCVELRMVESVNNAERNHTYFSFGFDNTKADAFIKLY